eukprot:GHVO01019809.1.p1 GENE.GHVO01019809.1~~GHVO01019809.1.p1  ORF type:complete len:102 (-),score=1.86 GHVO01019809.1:25-330(-)
MTNYNTFNQTSRNTAGKFTILRLCSANPPSQVEEVQQCAGRVCIFMSCGGCEEFGVCLDRVCILHVLRVRSFSPKSLYDAAIADTSTIYASVSVEPTPLLR